MRTLAFHHGHPGFRGHCGRWLRVVGSRSLVIIVVDVVVVTILCQQHRYKRPGSMVARQEMDSRWF